MEKAKKITSRIFFEKRLFIEMFFER